MSYEESEARQKSNMGFRTVMDIGMGLFYTIVGAYLMITKSFAGFVLPVWLAWLLGGMMFVGGILRFYKGIKTVMPGKSRTS